MNVTTTPSTGLGCDYCWLIGVAVTFVGQIINNFGTNVVKYSHLHTQIGHSKRKSWIIFFSGWLLFVIGISFDFVCIIFFVFEARF
jgi:uncharacterized membrane protein YoaK (UPF0700 family)